MEAIFNRTCGHVINKAMLEYTLLPIRFDMVNLFNVYWKMNGSDV